MTDPAPLLALASAGLVGVALICTVALRGWSEWLALRREMLAGSAARAPAHSPAGRIELADLKERVRRLEAIASGVDL